MKSVASSEVVEGLLARLRKLTPESERHWGTLSAGEMLCHVGDTLESVLRHRIPPGPPPNEAARPFLKWLILYAPIPWPRGVKTRPGVNPKIDGTRPGSFEADRARVITRLAELTTAPAVQLAPVHFMVGPMSRSDWQRWAYRHTDHHLRQFGL